LRIFYVAVYVSEISRETRRDLREGRECRMQLVRVATKDFQNASLLVVHLAGLFGGEHVSLQADGEVQVRLPELNGELVKTLKAVERWLEQSGIASAEVSVNEHSFTVEHPQLVKIAVDDRQGAREAVGRP
jgi:hypothetical protein